MHIEELCVQDVRNLATVSCSVGPGLNLFLGRNGSGKTAILEAIFLLGRGRSFRTSRVSDIPKRPGSSLQVTARLKYANSDEAFTGIERVDSRLQIRFNREPVRQISTHTARFPLVLITPESQDLVFGAPKTRRHWLDWALFHVEQSYLINWKNYHRALRQRNCLLRIPGREGELVAWEEEMVRAGSALHESRERFVGALRNAFAQMATDIWTGRPDIVLQPGWNQEKSLLDALRDARSGDINTGFTRYGPHRADLRFTTEDVPVADICSRGQGKLFITLVALGQALVFRDFTGEPPILLLDDISAELDLASRVQVVRRIRDMGLQTMVTDATERPEWTRDQVLHVFHVEHGRVRKC